MAQGFWLHLGYILTYEILPMLDFLKFTREHTYHIFLGYIIDIRKIKQRAHVRFSKNSFRDDMQDAEPESLTSGRPARSGRM